ncbi:MAG: hypothetical protein J6D09_06785 [Clostridia bacterium]|nr:hypothetical protein [Clostridia bacterium]
MRESEFDALIFKTIKAIEEHNDSAFKPRIKTIVSFLKGAEASPFYSYFIEHKDICGEVSASPKMVEESCLRLCNRNLIVRHAEKGKVVFYETKPRESFLEQCTQEEQRLISEIENHLRTKNEFIHSVDKKNRYAFYDSRIKCPDGIKYAWMWFVFKDMELIFRYKISATDNDNISHEGNQIVANDFHKKTIINLIDLII